MFHLAKDVTDDLISLLTWGCCRHEVRLRINLSVVCWLGIVSTLFSDVWCYCIDFQYTVCVSGCVVPACRLGM